MALFASHYAALQVDRRADGAVIKAAYHALMKAHHPDHGGDGKLAPEITEAYHVLSDATRRAAYDDERNKKVGTQIGSFKIQRQIASGGFGPTYYGEHVLTGMPVCVKHCHKISAVSEKILMDEAKAMWDLRHYAIPAIRDLVRLEDDSVALVMSYIPGPTLTQLVEKHGALDPEHVAWITERILNALMYLHDHGVVHGDLKPQNIILQPERHAVALVDFGLSSIKPDEKSGNKGWTKYFSPPEQEDETASLIPETDFFALGMTMIYALGGSMDLVKARRVPVNTPDPLCDFIKPLIVRDVLQRPREAGKLFDEMQHVRERAFGRRRSGMKPLPTL